MTSPQNSLESAIARFIAGDDTAGDAIGRALLPSLRCSVLRYLDADDAEVDDVIQDSLLAVLGYLRKTGQPPDNATAFASTIARNRCLNLGVWRRRRNPVDVDRFHERIPDVAASPLEIVDAEERRSLLRKILDELDGPCRDLLEAVYQREQSFESVRQSLGLKSVQAVYYRKDACIRKAQKILNRRLLGGHRAGTGLPASSDPRSGMEPQDG